MLTADSDDELLRAVWVRIRLTRAVKTAIEARKPKANRKPVTWQQVYDAFAYKGEKLEPDLFQQIVESFSGQDVEPDIVAG